MHSEPYLEEPWLLADIGGTNARFALGYASGRIDQIAVLASNEYENIVDAVHAYLTRCPAVHLVHAVIAIANPVSGDYVKMTNHPWQFSIEAARRALKFDTLLVVNDFAALAMAVPALKPKDLEKVGGGTARSGEVIGLVGAGTGLGVAGLIRAGGHWLTLESEGGHVAFSPSDERELAVLQYCWKRYDHVSAERLVSGPGIELIYQALAAQQAMPLQSLDTAAIVARGLNGTDQLCRETIDCFCGMLGTVAANVAVTLCARGGIYIGGGVVPHLGNYFASSPFRERFENTGRLRPFNAQIATMVITATNPAFLGAVAILTEHLADVSSNAHTIRPIQGASKTGVGMRS
jgi:glucokinase